MDETKQPDQDPAPLEHSDAERVGGREAEDDGESVKDTDEEAAEN